MPGGDPLKGLHGCAGRMCSLFLRGAPFWSGLQGNRKEATSFLECWFVCLCCLCLFAASPGPSSWQVRLHDADQGAHQGRVGASFVGNPSKGGVRTSSCFAWTRFTSHQLVGGFSGFPEFPEILPVSRFRLGKDDCQGPWRGEQTQT